ncbi:MAG TPA: glutathionylspermidine synthase family protein [Nitrospiraceae bacterium]|nr:glutathionylspermidine synthase family protein [Nitrospiraceae bacterium]
MMREQSTPRADWPRHLAAAGVTFHSLEGPYWREDVCYRFSEREIGELERATIELHQMCLSMVEEVITHDRFDDLRIRPEYRPIICESWNQHHPPLFGRFDLRYDGASPPVLLEYNADTPFCLIESSVAQWHWLEMTRPGKDQFNSLHERLVDQWRRIHHIHRGPLHLTGLPESAEEAQTVAYIQDTAMQAGLETIPIPLKGIGWDLVQGRFVDQFNHPITMLFKLYPWEWLLGEPFGSLLIQSSLIMIEPAWKMVLNNKGILALLWEQFPGHPNLLPAFFTPEPLGNSYVRKPLFSREGANVEIISPTQTIGTSGPYGEEGWLYQAYAPLPDCHGWRPVIGSWVVGSEPAGIGIRETEGLITDDTCRFVPHYLSHNDLSPVGVLGAL